MSFKALCMYVVSIKYDTLEVLIKGNPYSSRQKAILNTKAKYFGRINSLFTSSCLAKD